jgi:hypothetical protein
MPTNKNDNFDYDLVIKDKVERNFEAEQLSNYFVNMLAKSKPASDALKNIIKEQYRIVISENKAKGYDRVKPWLLAIVPSIITWLLTYYTMKH